MRLVSRDVSKALHHWNSIFVNKISADADINEGSISHGQQGGILQSYYHTSPTHIDTERFVNSGGRKLKRGHVQRAITVAKLHSLVSLIN
jgi:hypothetical protein